MEICIVPRIDELITGLWCPRCAKPSGYRVPIDFLYTFGVTKTAMKVGACYDCNRQLPVNEPI